MLSKNRGLAPSVDNAPWVSPPDWPLWGSSHVVESPQCGDSPRGGGTPPPLHPPGTGGGSHLGGPGPSLPTHAHPIPPSIDSGGIPDLLHHDSTPWALPKKIRIELCMFIESSVSREGRQARASRAPLRFVGGGVRPGID